MTRIAHLPPTKRRRIAAWIAPPMFVLSLLFLVGVAALVVLWVDLPSLRERTVPGAEGEPTALAAAVGAEVDFQPAEKLARGVVFGLLLLWPLFWIEGVYHWAIYPWTRRYRAIHLRQLVFGLVPPLRLGARCPEFGGAIWYPWLGWRRPDNSLRETLTRFFSIPMLLIAVLILPALGIELFMEKQVHSYPALRYALHFSTGLIWLAFTVEFILMISAEKRKLGYCKRHWLDLAIILLPIISFLRSLQILRATRLAKLTKVQQLTKMARVYRLRGLSTKALRALILFDLLQRLIRIHPAKRLSRLREQHSEMQRAIADLELRIADLERQVELAEQDEETAAEATAAASETPSSAADPPPLPAERSRQVSGTSR